MAKGVEGFRLTVIREGDYQPLDGFEILVVFPLVCRVRGEQCSEELSCEDVRIFSDGILSSLRLEGAALPRPFFDRGALPVLLRLASTVEGELSPPFLLRSHTKGESIEKTGRLGK